MSYQYNPEMNRRLKTIRKRLGLTQKQMSQTIGMSDANFSNLERHAKIVEHTVISVCSLFGVRYDYFVSGIGPMFDETTKLEKDLLASFQALTPQYQKIAVHIVGDFANIAQETEQEMEECR